MSVLFIMALRGKRIHEPPNELRDELSEHKSWVVVDSSFAYILQFLLLLHEVFMLNHVFIQALVPFEITCYSPLNFIFF